MNLEDGQMAARQTGLAMLATLRAGLGSLDRVVRVVKLLGLVRSTDAFDQQPAVINGCSQLFVDLWGKRLRHREPAVRLVLMHFLAESRVEIEGIFEVRS